MRGAGGGGGRTRVPPITSAAREEERRCRGPLSVSYILQEPLGRDRTSQAARLGQFVHPTAHARELQTLVADIAIEGYLITTSAAYAFPGDEIGKFRLVAAFSAIAELRAVAAEAGRLVLGRNALHLFGRAADIGRGRQTALGLETLGLAHLQPGDALAHDDVEFRHHGFGHLAAAEIGDVHAILHQVGVVHRNHGIGAVREDVGALDRFARGRNGADFDVELFRHLLGVSLAARRVGAVDFAEANVAHAGEGLQEGAGHAARAEHADDVRVLAREPFHPNARAAADAHMLEHAVIDEGERLAVAAREKIDDAAIGARLAAIFFLGPIAVVVLGPEDDIGLHADRHVAVIGAFHRAPAVIAVLNIAGH